MLCKVYVGSATKQATSQLRQALLFVFQQLTCGVLKGE